MLDLGSTMSAQPVHFLAPDLARWDATQAEALVLPFFEDERPLRGAAGMADWRLCGRISRLLKKGKLTGKAGETVLLPPAGGRLPFPRLLLVGLGKSDRFDEAAYREAVRRIRGIARKAGVTRYALQPPGRAPGLIAPRRALELWLDESGRDGIAAEVTIIESPSGQKEMAEALRAKGKPT